MGIGNIFKIDDRYINIDRWSIIGDNCLLKTGSFPHDNFSSVYWIFTNLDHMIPLWKGKNRIYFGVIRSKVKVTININRISDNRIVSAW
jgi:hypothetical protein